VRAKIAWEQKLTIEQFNRDFPRARKVYREEIDAILLRGYRTKGPCNSPGNWG
jgi:hypothetical protein